MKGSDLFNIILAVITILVMLPIIQPILVNIQNATWSMNQTSNSTDSPILDMLKQTPIIPMTMLILIGGLVIATLKLFTSGPDDYHYEPSSLPFTYEPDHDDDDEPEPSPETDTVECIYCGTIYDKHFSQCPYCSAPHTRRNVFNVGDNHG